MVGGIVLMRLIAGIHQIIGFQIGNLNGPVAVTTANVQASLSTFTTASLDLERNDDDGKNVS